MGSLDDIDLTLLRMLQENGRVAQNDLARAVGLSAPGVADRLRKLEERGVIRGYSALLDARRLGLGVTAHIAVGIAGSGYFGEFRAQVTEREEIVECHSVTGQGSHLLKVKLRDTEALEELLAEIQSWPGVQWTSTSVVLSTVKETCSLPLPEPSGEGAAGTSGARQAGVPVQVIHVPFRHHS